MTFLPEDDRDYLGLKGYRYEEIKETLPNQAERRGILLPSFAFSGALFAIQESGLVPCQCCDVMILIPDGYATTKLDSFYTSQHLKRADGSDPAAATVINKYFDRDWQFWSRHLDESEWRVGVDGLSTYIGYIIRELKAA